MDFLDYVPYHQMGLSYLKLGDYASAIRKFNLEIAKGEIKRTTATRSCKGCARRSRTPTARRRGLARARSIARPRRRPASSPPRRLDEALARYA